MKIGNMRFSKDDIPFTMVANEVLKNPALSWKAKGMYAYLFSKPDQWEFSNRRIVTESNGGRHAVLSALNELRDAGLLIRVKLPNGKMLYNLKHASAQSPKTEPSLFDKPKSENPKVRKPEGAKTRPVSNTVKEVIQKTSKTENSTPGETARKFFEGDVETCAPIATALEQAGIPASLVARELGKFKAYWTEPTRSGRKTRWELQPTFDVRRRLGTWFRNIAERTSTRRAGAGVTV